MRVIETSLPNEIVSGIVVASSASDHRSPVNELGQLALAGRRPASCFVALDGEMMVGVALIDHRESTVQLTVHPAHRRRGIGTVLGRAAAAHPAARIWWAFGNSPAARALARRLGLVQVRELLQMGRAIGPEERADPPTGVVLDTFRRADGPDLIAVNARAFANHPEQGNLTIEDFELLTAQPWFDPAGLIVARREGRPVGFHWTKKHDDQTGEVYVLAVDPAVEGMGIGRALLMAGLTHLRHLGLLNVLLYVESSAQRVVELYRAAGFDVTNADASYIAEGG